MNILEARVKESTKEIIKMLVDEGYILKPIDESKSNGFYMGVMYNHDGKWWKRYLKMEDKPLSYYDKIFKKLNSPKRVHDFFSYSNKGKNYIEQPKSGFEKTFDKCFSRVRSFAYTEYIVYVFNFEDGELSRGTSHQSFGNYYII